MSSRREIIEAQYKIKSLQASIEDLQEALEFVTKKTPDKTPAISNAWAALDRLKASGNYVEKTNGS